MARKTDTNRVTVSGTVTQELSDFLEDYRWKNRKNRSVVVGEAIAGWAKSVGFEESTTGEEPSPTDADTDADAAPADDADAESEPVAKPAAKRAR